MSAFQLGVYHATDIVVTAGLIGAGSDGIHALADLPGEYLKHTKPKMLFAAQE
jgi:hypothetical protein